jgi:hypothetical protein
MLLRWSCTVGLLFIGMTGQSIADDKPAKVPEEIQQAENTLTKWINGFRGQTLAEIRKSLGDPSTETTWLFKEKKEPLLKYQIGKTTELSLRFYGGRVVSVALHLLPRSTSSKDN